MTASSIRARLRTPSAQIAGSDGDLSLEATVRRNVGELLTRALRAACGRDPRHRFFVSWWRGTDIEAAFGYLHKAEVEATRLYDDYEVAAEIPAALSRIDIASIATTLSGWPLDRFWTCLLDLSCGAGCGRWWKSVTRRRTATSHVSGTCATSY